MNSVKPTLIDSHCHLDLIPAADAAVVLANAEQQGVEQIVVPGLYPEQWQTLAALSNRHRGVYWAAGFHPWWLEKAALTLDNAEHALLEAASHPACVAIGETGLDGLKGPAIDTQARWLAMHIRVAKRLDKPVIIHAVKSHNRLQRVIAELNPPLAGVLHGFSGSMELAKWYWSKGLHLGVGGVITYPRARKTRAAIASASLPLEALVLETDAPDMPLHGHQGEPNSPGFLPKVAQALAELRGDSIQEVIAHTSNNSRKLFGLSE